MSSQVNKLWKGLTGTASGDIIIPETTTAALMPERSTDVSASDISLGADSSEDTSQGKRKLRRPRTSLSTGDTSTGLSV